MYTNGMAKHCQRRWLWSGGGCCLSVPLTEPGRHSTWIERDIEEEERESHHAARFFKPLHQARTLIQLPIRVSLPLLLYTHIYRHTSHFISRGIEREGKWMTEGGRWWTWERRRERVRKRGKPGLKAGRACHGVKVKGSRGNEWSRARQSLRTLWDSVCNPSHDPIWDFATRVLGVPQHTQELSEGEDELRTDRHKHTYTHKNQTSPKRHMYAAKYQSLRWYGNHKMCKNMALCMHMHHT